MANLKRSKVSKLKLEEARREMQDAAKPKPKRGKPQAILVRKG